MFMAHTSVMKTHSLKNLTIILLIGLFVFYATHVRAQTTNAVTSGNLVDYTINGLADPGFTFQRGVTYVFTLNGIVGHPFWIKTNLTGSFTGGAGAFNTGVINNGATSGSLVFTVPVSAPNQLFYQCGNHSGMSGVLTIVTPTATPTVKIVFVDVANFITIKSTGTNGWSAVPEFRCGTSGTNWSVVATFTNAFASGTNTTTFPRLESVCGSTNVLVRIRNQSN